MLRMPRVPSAVGEQTVRRARQGTPHRRRRVWQQRAAAGGTSATCLLPPRPAPKPAKLSHAMVLLSWLLLPLRVAAVAASAWWQGAPAVPEGPMRTQHASRVTTPAGTGLIWLEWHTQGAAASMSQLVRTEGARPPARRTQLADELRLRSMSCLPVAPHCGNRARTATSASTLCSATLADPAHAQELQAHSAASAHPPARRTQLADELGIRVTRMRELMSGNRVRSV